MGIVHDIIHPETFLGITDLKTGSFICAAVELIMTIVAVIGLPLYAISLGSIITLICTGLGVYGILKDNKGYVLIYEIYLIVSVVIAFVSFCFSFLYFSLSFIVKCFILLVISLYACRVVNAYYKTMDSSLETDNKAAYTANKVVDAVDAAAAKV